jgi:glucokinase
LGIGLGNVTNLLNLERIVVGVGVAGAGEMILEPSRKSLAEIAHSVSRASVEVVPAVLGNKAGLLGAARLVMAGGNFQP